MMPDKELRKIVRFCQKNGIVKFKSGDFEIEIKENRPKLTKSKGEALVEDPKDTFPAWESLTDEQKLFWSSTPDTASNS